MDLILGAGPAGLSAAYHLEHDNYLILEQESEIGGLCRSFEIEGATFDYGGHAFFTKYEYVKELLLKLNPEGLFRQARSAWVYSHETYIPYPFQANLYGLPTKVVQECLSGLYKVNGKEDTEGVQSIHDWIEDSFGDGISKHFMLPYNNKIWAHPLKDVVPIWAGNRIVKPNVDEVIAGAVERTPFKDYPNAYVIYAKNGGFIDLYKGFLDHIDPNKIIYNKTVIAIDVEAKEAICSTGEKFKYDRLISTIPLTELVKKTPAAPTSCIDAAAKLKHFSLHLVNIVVKKKNLTDKQRVYCADPDVPFHKLVLNSNSSDSLRESESFAIQAEVSYSPYKHVDTDTLEQKVIDSLIKMKLITEEDPILATSIIDVPLAYPVYTKDWQASRDILFNYFQSNDVYCAGRFGEWLYINSDGAVMRGKAAAEALSQEKQCA